MDLTPSFIAPCLWFDDHAEEAADFYCSIFPNSKIGRITRHGKAGEEIPGRPEAGISEDERALLT